VDFLQNKQISGSRRVRKAFLFALIFHISLLFITFPDAKPVIYLKGARQYIKINNVNFVQVKQKPRTPRKKKKKTVSVPPVKSMNPIPVVVEESIEEFETIVPEFDSFFTEPDLSSFEPMSVQKCDVPPRILNEVLAEYPSAAMISGVEGKVVIECIISERGKVTETEIIGSSGRDDFDVAAVNAAKKFKFSPALLAGKPVRVYFTLKIDFTLE